MNRYFITGTDTDCGKTYVTQQLVRCFPNAAAIKPVASGCKMVKGKLISDDALYLQNNSCLSLEQINPWSFQAPVSPHIAAEEERAELTIDQIAEYCLQWRAEGVERLFIEGAGGLMVPLNYQETWIDFLKKTGIPVILVVGMKLGCINHALLTVSSLQLHGIQSVGWIANCIDSEMLALDKNINTLKTLIQAPLLAVIPFAGALQEFEL